MRLPHIRTKTRQVIQGSGISERTEASLLKPKVHSCFFCVLELLVWETMKLYSKRFIMQGWRLLSDYLATLFRYSRIEHKNGPYHPKQTVKELVLDPKP